MAIPAFGLGTFRLKDDVVISSVKTALELGYRAIDTAQIYDNEAAVGQAIAESDDAPRDKCAHFREINGIAAAFQHLQKNYIPAALSFL